MKLPDFELERYFARYEFDLPYLLSSSDVETHDMSELLAMADDECQREWTDLSLGYTQAPGHPLLRREIAGLYETVPEEGVLVFSGAEEAIFALSNVVIGDRADDRTAVVSPAYQSLYEVPRSAGAELDFIELRHADGWALDLDSVRAAVGPSTRLVTLNFPHNPTGAQPDSHTFTDAVRIGRDAGATVLSDEVYRFLEPAPEDRLPAAADLDAGAVSLGVMSKSFGLPGLRIGWLATRDVDLLRRVAAFKDYLTICNSAPSEVLALIALRARQRVLSRNLAIVEDNRRHADDFFARWPGIFEWVRPGVGCIGFPRSRADSPVDQVARDLAEQAGVMLLPGTAYGHPGNHFRLGFGRRDFPEALDRLDQFTRATLA